MRAILPVLLLCCLVWASMTACVRGECSEDSHCEPGYYCRDLPPKEDELVPEHRACVPYQKPFESCEGFTFSWLMEHCDPRNSNCVSLDPQIEDAPGICLVRCSDDNSSCPEDMFCDSTGEHCLSDNVGKSEINCLVDADCDLASGWIHPECVGYAVCNNNRCGWVCGERSSSSSSPVIEEPRMGSSAASSTTIPDESAATESQEQQNTADSDVANEAQETDYIVSPKRVQKRASSAQGSAKPVGGGWKPIDLDNNNDPRLDQVIEFCVNYLNENNHKDGASDEENAKLPPKTLHQVQSAARQIVAGTKYRIVLDTLTGFDNPLEVHEFEVFLTLTHELKMLEHEFLSSSSLHTCALPKASGFCQISLPRWFYNVETGKCERFRFGCGGNANNFGTQEDCLATCASYNP